jgi:hypothetical protein
MPSQHVIITLVRVYTAFIQVGPDTSPTKALAALTEPRQVARMALTLFIILMFDSLLVRSCWQNFDVLPLLRTPDLPRVYDLREPLKSRPSACTAFSRLRHV